MQKRIVSSQEEGRRLERYLEKQLPRAPKSLLYKLLRTKAVKVNGKRVQDPKYSLSSGDQVEIYLADARIAELQESDTTLYNSKQILYGMSQVQVLYDDENLIIFNKPAGMLSQKDRADAISLTEIGAAIIRRNQEEIGGFCPGVCNRLDRNTSGAVIMAKTVRAAQAINEMIREGKIHKFYLAIVVGECGWKDTKLLTHYWHKDPKRNTVTVSDLPTGLPDEAVVKCRCHVERCMKDHSLSLLRIELITGKGHQIRAQLAHMGYPILGDPKYGVPIPGGSSISARFLPDPSRSAQMLHAHQLHFTECPPLLSAMEDAVVTAPPPQAMDKVLAAFH